MARSEELASGPARRPWRPRCSCLTARRRRRRRPLPERPAAPLLAAARPRRRLGPRSGTPTGSRPADEADARPAGAPGRGTGRARRGVAARGPARVRRAPRHLGGRPLFAKIDDARDMLAAMRGRCELDLRRTGIVGHGEGAGMALSVAIGDPAVSALTLDRASRPAPGATCCGAAWPTREPDGHGPRAPDRRGDRPLERGDHRARRATRGERSTLPLRGAGTRAPRPGRHRAGDPHAAAGAGDDAASVGGAGPWRGRRLGRPGRIGAAGGCAGGGGQRAARRLVAASRPRPGGGERRGRSARSRPTWPAGSCRASCPRCCWRIEEMGVR